MTFDPNPRTLCPDPILGTREGYKFCSSCGGIKEPEHDHSPEQDWKSAAYDIGDRWRETNDERLDAIKRAEFAESLLCALAFDHELWLLTPRYESHPGSGCVFCEGLK